MMDVQTKSTERSRQLEVDAREVSDIVDVIYVYSSFLLVINGDHLTSEFIQSSLRKLKKTEGCAIGSYLTDEDLFITREILKILLIDKTLRNSVCLYVHKQIRCEHIHLIEINRLETQLFVLFFF